MGELVSLAEKREDQESYSTGEVRCVACGHEWIQVAPKSLSWFECEKCGLHKGNWKYPFERGEVRFVCNCGNVNFQIVPGAIYCPACGDDVSPDDF